MRKTTSYVQHTCVIDAEEAEVIYEALTESVECTRDMLSDESDPAIKNNLVNQLQVAQHLKAEFAKLK